MENFKQLSRAEMRNVLGGKPDNVQCAYVGSGGVSYTTYSGADLDTIQDLADGICYDDGNNDACGDVTCKYV